MAACIHKNRPVELIFILEKLGLLKESNALRSMSVCIHKNRPVEPIFILEKLGLL
jgi:hypothetical protein